MSKEKTVSMNEYTEFAAALRALADASDDAIARMRKEGISEAESSNYSTAVRGFGYILKFVNGVAGTATTASIKDQISPVVEELRKIEAGLKKEPAEASDKAAVGRPKKKS